MKTGCSQPRKGKGRWVEKGEGSVYKSLKDFQIERTPEDSVKDKGAN